MSAELASPTDRGSVVIVPRDKVRALQHTLYRAAKADPGRRFHTLHQVRSRACRSYRSCTTVCFLGTACGDDSRLIATFYDNAWREGWSASHIALFPMPNVADLRQHLVSQDVVWVWGGSVAGLLAMWRMHGLDVAVRDAWQAGSF